MQVTHYRDRHVNVFLTWGLLETIAVTAVVLLLSWRLRSFAYVAVWSLLGWTQMIRTRRSTALGLWMFAPVSNFASARLLDHMELFGAVKRVGKHLIGIEEHAPAPELTRDREAKTDVPIHYTDRIAAVLIAASREIRLSDPFGWLPGIVILSTAMVIASTAILTVVLLLAIVLVTAATMARFASTSWMAICHPLEALHAIPGNWRRIAWSLDLKTPFEFVPRHALLLRLRNRGGSVATSKNVLSVFDPRKMKFGFHAVRRMVLCLTIGSALTWIPVSLHNPPPPATSVPREEWDDISKLVFKMREERVRAGMRYFDIFEWRDWHVRLLWCSKWPERHFGYMLGFSRTISLMLYVAIAGMLVATLAVYIGIWTTIGLFLLSTPLRALLFTPTLLYRISLKASALTYAPLFFVAEGAVDPYADPKLAFEEEQYAVWPAIRRWLASIIGFFLLSKLLFKTIWTSVAAKSPVPDLLNPAYIYPWEVASGIVIFLTFAIWLLTRNALWRFRASEGQSLESVGHMVRACQRLRSVFSIYTTACLVLLWSSIDFHTILEFISLPEIRWIILPLNK